MANTRKKSKGNEDWEAKASRRIALIIEHQKQLVEEFKKTGDKRPLAKFKELAAEFQRIHEEHKLRISN